MSKSISIGALTSIESAAGKAVKQEGKTTGILTLKTAEGPVEITLDEFDSTYRGFVRCWPAIKPLKDKIIEARREETAEAKKAEREAEAKRKAQEKKDAAAKREQERANAKAAKEQAKADAKAAKEAEAKAAKAAKIKADTAKAKKAAEAKAKRDAAAGE